MQPLTRAYRAGCALPLATLVAVLAACSSKSDSGTSQGATVPTAIATPIGYRGTGTNPTTLTVRSGADVQLTGINSTDGNVGISSFEWKQTDAAPIPQVSLIYRNASTVSFTAPSVASPTTLHLQLTVSNGVGANSTAVQVSVQPASDPNRFLSLLATPHRFRVALSLTDGSATAGTPLALRANIPVCVRLSEHIEYQNYSHTSSAFPLPDQTVETQWLAAAGAMAGFVQNPPAYLAFRNPVVTFDLPVLDENLIFAAYNQPGANSTQVGEQLVASDIDTAYVPMQISATPGTCDGTASQSALGGLRLMLQLEDEAGDPVGAAATGPADGAVTVSQSALPAPDPLTPAGSGSTALTADDFLRVAQATNPQVETRESAAAYYAAINPSSEVQKTTLQTWLQNNCFDPASPTYGEGESGYDVVHATYTNNFDLGFGRDMYFATCSNGHLASVVINYPSIDTAANKVGAFLAVAMEYAPQAGSSGPCFTNLKDPTTNTGMCFAKFYAFAPDDRTGEFGRVMSVDFDRRGQKYLPGACTVCHGGAPSYTPGATAGAKYHGTALRGTGDLEAVFMPWDVGSLLYSDTDPSFACTVSSASPSCTSLNPASFTQAAQAPHLQQLNALSWSTYDIYSANGKKDVIAGVKGVSGDAPCAVPNAPGEPCVLRFQGGVDLLTKWYGGNPAAASAHAFDDSATPSTWMLPDAGSAPNDLYHQVFAHYCRSCHVQSNVPSEQFASGFTPLTPIATFGTPPNVQHLVFDRAQMPLSRLTADRFWVNFAGGQSAAQTLASYINARSSPDVAAVAENQGQVIPPGAPLLVVETSNVLGSNNSGALSTASVNALNRFQGASLNAFTQSLFVSSYQWTLCSSATSECASDPLGVVATPPIPGGSSAGAAQSGTSFTGLTTSAAGSFYLTLTANSSVVGQPPLIQTFPLKVTATDPVLAGCTTSPTANFNGQPVTIDVSPCFAQSNGQPQLGDPPYTLQISYDGVTYGASAGSASLAWQASVLPPSGVLNLKTGFPVAPPTIQFNFTPNATAGVPLYFKWCDGNHDATSCVAGSEQITFLTGLTASPAAFLGYWDPTVNPNYGGVFAPPVTGLPIRPTLSLGALDGALGVNAPSATLTLAAPSDGGSLSSASLTGSAASLATQLNLLTYAPCGKFVTQDVNGSDTTSSILLDQLEPPCTLPIAGGVTFPYTLSDGSQSQSSLGTINIRALSSFRQTPSQVYAILGANCSNSSCHGGFGTIFWRYDATSANSTYATISTGHDNLGGLLVKPGLPAQSAFYTASCFGTTASGGPLFGMVQVFQPTAPECQILYQWILEGGQNN